MKITVTRSDSGLRIDPSPAYLLKFLRYRHREMQTVNWKRDCVFVEKLLYVTDEGGTSYTLQGFYSDIVKLIGKNMDVLEIIDIRTPMPEPDWAAIKAIKLRDYQVDMVLDMIFKGTEDSGVINATGGSGNAC